MEMDKIYVRCNRLDAILNVVLGRQLRKTGFCVRASFICPRDPVLP